MLRRLFVFLVSPTRLALEQFRTKPRRAWNWAFRCLVAGFLLALWFARTPQGLRNLPYGLGYLLLWLLPFSRINELAIGFYYDAIERFEGARSKTRDAAVDRIKSILAAYCEVAVQFGILYFCLFPGGSFTRSFHSIVEAVYFSVVTISTVGYGDIAPATPWTQITAMYELGVGFLIVAFVLGSYLATTSGEPDNDRGARSRKE
jgi:voltage-gated potassium channel Kch